jgi:hypothetical protein
MAATPSSIRISAALLILVLLVFLCCNMNKNSTAVLTIVDTQCPCLSSPNQLSDTSFHADGWQPIGHTHEEQVHLRDMSTVVAAWPETAEDNVPTVPCLSADGHLLVLSVGASRVRYGVSLTFVMVYPSYVKAVLPKDISSEPLFSHQLSLWCVFHDGSVTPAYSYDSKDDNDHVSLLDCPLSPFASDQLWKHNQTLRVYLASTTDKDRNAPILKAFVSIPTPLVNAPNNSQELFTLCTSPLHNNAKYLTQWIEFHRLVGFRKFVVYNTSDTDDDLSTIIRVYTRKYPNLVDVIQWNFSSLALVDVQKTQYFQTEALQDCLVRYGDRSEWLGILDLDEYIVPLHPYETVVDYIHANFGRRIIGSVNLWSQFFCAHEANKYTLEKNDTSPLTIEQFILRVPNSDKNDREQYLYRPRFVQYLSIHRQTIERSKQQPSENNIILAHYSSIDRLRPLPGCDTDRYVVDTGVRDRFANRVKNAITALTV